MTNTRHTPGPWVVRNRSDAMAEKFTVERLTNDGLRSVICRINDMEVCPEHGGTGSEANAHLIAAAPAMYAALQKISDLYRKAYESDGEFFLDESEIGSLADAALAQAEGSKP